MCAANPFRVNRILIDRFPGLSLAPTAGLKLANAFGVSEANKKEIALGGDLFSGTREIKLMQRVCALWSQRTRDGRSAHRQ